jgi:hypothetical protein
MTITFSVKNCDTNPQRWYINFNLLKPFLLSEIKTALERNDYQTLASTPSIMVFRLNNTRLTWHSQGLIQVDYSDRKKKEKTVVCDYIENLIQIIDFKGN